MWQVVILPKPVDIAIIFGQREATKTHPKKKPLSIYWSSDKCHVTTVNYQQKTTIEAVYVQFQETGG